MPSIGNDLLSPIGRYFEKYVPTLSYAVLITHRSLPALIRESRTMMHDPSCLRTQQELSVICYMPAAMAGKYAAEHHSVVNAGGTRARRSPFRTRRVYRWRKRASGNARPPWVRALRGSNLNSRQVVRLAKFCGAPRRADQRSATCSSEK